MWCSLTTRKRNTIFIDDEDKKKKKKIKPSVNVATLYTDACEREDWISILG